MPLKLKATKNKPIFLMKITIVSQKKRIYSIKKRKKEKGFGYSEGKEEEVDSYSRHERY